ncbi:MAG: type II toxin-antitoxin system HicB family antitoxin [Candidatus Atribacteria bacterium]|nr:MAG: type II toxin-antitoxin system HicB family antitoxin [Candidatus Atribacteria bacterium]
MSFLTTVLRKSGDYWVALCLENGVVSQGFTKEEALIKMREAIASLELAFSDDPSLFSAPIAINELHEFLSIERPEPILETFELRAVYA